MKQQFKRFLILISTSVLMVFPQNSTWSCGPELNPDATIFGLFQREIADDPGLEPFYYTTRFLNSDADPQQTDYHRNCREWVAFTGNKVTEKDVFNVQYNLSPNAFMHACNTNEWEGLADNTFVKWLQANKPAMDYFAFAKMLEFTQSSTNGWDDVIYATLNYDSAISLALSKCKSPLPEFLKQRYAFQAVKTSFYLVFNGDQLATAKHNIFKAEVARLKQCYNTYLKGKKTIAADWGLLYYANVEANDYQRALYYMDVFDRCESKKVFIYINLSTKALNGILPSLHDPKKRSNIYAYQAMRNDGRAMQQIEQVAANNAKSKYLRMVIGKEINKIEDWILSYPMQGFTPRIATNKYERKHDWRTDKTYEFFIEKNRVKDLAYTAKFRQFLHVLAAKKSADKDFLNLAIVHLYQIEGNFNEAAICLRKIPHLKSSVLEAQRIIEQTINIAYTSDIENTSVQADLEANLCALEKSGLRDSVAAREYYFDDWPNAIMNELYLMLSRQYQKKNDVVKAGLMFKKAAISVNEYLDYYGYYSSIDYFDKYACVANIDSLLHLKHKANKTPFEKRLATAINADDNIYLDLKTTLLVRQGLFEQALDVANTLPDDFWVTHYEFKEYLKKSDISALSTIIPAATGLDHDYAIESKKAILQDVVSLRAAYKNAVTDSAKASFCFILGNCYYNMTYGGKDWMMYSYGKSYNEMEVTAADNWKWVYYSFYPNIKQHAAVYFQCARATEQYKMALHYAPKDKELGAACMLMLGLCDKSGHDFTIGQQQNNYVRQSRYKGCKPWFSPYLKRLKRDYGQTEIFDKAATECPDIEQYLKTI